MTITETGAGRRRVGSNIYRTWFLVLLILVYASSFVDRIITAVVGQAMKIDLNLSDLELGLLGGLAFSIFYSTLGLPFARIADKHNRVRLIAFAIIAWSVMTALCGMAHTYWQLLLCRLGVGVGEAGSTPTAQSLISDQFPARRRASALAVYALGPPLGVIVGAIGGGMLVQHMGWRPVFLVFGLPGLIFGLLTLATLKEPRRGGADGLTDDAPAPSLGAVFARLRGSPVFVQMLLGTVIAAFTQYGVNLFIPVYLNRVYGMSFAQAGLAFGLIVGVGGIVGNTLGGVVADRASARDRRWYAWVPALGTLIGFPLLVVALQMRAWPAAVALMLLATISFNTWNGPTFALLHGLVEPRMRATASAILFLLMNLVGQGLGPTTIGFLSDALARRFFDGGGDYRQVCAGKALAALGHAAQGAHGPLVAACHAASASGLRVAVLAVTVVLVWAALHYYRAARHIERN